MDAVALGLLVPVVRDPELVPRRALNDHVGRVDERPALGVRLPPAARPQVRVALFAHDHVGVLALVLDLVVGPADVEGRRGVEGVDGVRGDVPAVAHRADRVAQLQRVVAVRVVVRVLVRLHAADPRVGLPAVVDVPVEAGREVEVVEGPQVLGLEVVEPGRVVARVVGLPQAGQDLRGHGVPAVGGDHVAREGVAHLHAVDGARGQRVVDDARRAVRVVGLREVAPALQLGRQRVVARRGLRVLDRVEDGEQEELVLLDRQADRRPRVPVGVVVVLLGRPVAHRVEAGVAAEEVGRALDVVRARLHRHDRDAARAVAELGVHGVLLDRVLAHGVHGRRVAELVAGGERGPVEEDVVAVLGAAADVHLVGRPVVVGLGLDRAPALDRGGVQHGELQRVARPGGQVLHHLLLDREVSGRGVELDRGRRLRDGDRLLDAAHLQLEVHGDVAALLDADARLYGGLEPGQLGAHGVGPGLDEVEQVPSVGVRRAGVLDPVPSFVRTTVAPGRTPPLGSETRPCNRARMSCALADTAAVTRASARIALLRLEVLMASPLEGVPRLPQPVPEDFVWRGNSRTGRPAMERCNTISENVKRLSDQ